jgi:hypothetical protein
VVPGKGGFVHALSCPINSSKSVFFLDGQEFFEASPPYAGFVLLMNEASGA